MKLVITIERSKEVPHFGYIREIEREVNEHLKSKDYGGGLSNGFLYVVRSFSAERNAEDFFKPVEIYRPKKKEVSISHSIPFEVVVKEDKAEVLKLVAEGLFISIKKIKELGVKDFDIDEFLKDVENLSKKMKWV